MPTRIDETLPKQCTKCKETKAPNKFYRGSRRRKDGTWPLAPICKTCHINRMADWYERNPLWQKAYGKKYRQKYIGKPRRRFMAALYCSRKAADRGGYLPCDATPEELGAAHTGKCHVCQVPEMECRTHLHMDHCHETGKFRGWLCEHCNKAAGHLKESPTIAADLALYIMRCRVVPEVAA